MCPPLQGNWPKQNAKGFLIENWQLLKGLQTSFLQKNSNMSETVKLRYKTLYF